MRNGFLPCRVMAVLGLVVLFALAGRGSVALAAPSQLAADGRVAGQEASGEAVSADATPDTVDQDVVPTEEGVVTVAPVTPDPGVETPTTEVSDGGATEVPAETVLPAETEPVQDVTPDATNTMVPEATATATDAIEAAAVPTYIFPDPNVMGTVNVAKFACAGRSATTIDADVFAAAASLPSGPGSCTPTAGVVTFTFLGGLPNSSQLMVQNAGSIDLPAGNYDVVDNASGVHSSITLGGGQVVNLMIFGPLVGAPPTVAAGDGTVSIAVVDCTNVKTTTFDIDTFSAAAAQVDCTNSSARVTFYMVGDGTADYVQRVFTRSGSISLHPGVYEIVVEETQAHRFITVQSGKVVSMVIMKPLKTTGGAFSGSAEGEVPSSEVTPVAGAPDTSGSEGSEVSGTTDGGSDAVAQAGTTDETVAVAAVTTDRSVSTSTASTAGTSSSTGSVAPETRRAAPVITTLPRAGSGPVGSAPLATAWMLAAVSLLLFATGRSMRARERHDR